MELEETIFDRGSLAFVGQCKGTKVPACQTHNILAASKVPTEQLTGGDRECSKVE